MLTKRVIACLDVRAGRVVKGVQFADVRDVGDPVALAERYERDGADEIVFLDIDAAPDGRATMLDVARRTAERVYVPLTIGGGVRSADDVGRALRAGADKVAMNTAGMERPALFSEAAERYGTQCVVASIDAKRTDESWTVWTHGARVATGVDAIAWARECVERGAGEILLTSIDRDGARAGYDVELTRAVASAVAVPVIASGGAGTPRDCCEVLSTSGADAALVAGILHDGATTVRDIKRVLAREGVSVRSIDQ